MYKISLVFKNTYVCRACVVCVVSRTSTFLLLRYLFISNDLFGHMWTFLPLMYICMFTSGSLTFNYHRICYMHVHIYKYMVQYK